ncbi:exonuclease SbcCD subunit D [Macrococcus equipercicus]|nr:exonuclease SbcCD subunit D [Macrococcus equipercicus]
MKLMHIGDLHIGRTLNQHSLLEDQSYILGRIIEEIDRLHIELLIIAGDIYDRSLPSKEAVLVFEQFIRAVNIDRNIPVLAVSGNHDGAERLGYGKEWFKTHGFHISTAIADSFEPVVYDDIHFYLIPYIEPVEARFYFEDDTITSHGAAYSAVISRIEAQLDMTKTNIAVSHLFIKGGDESDSERPLSLGAVEYVPKELFNHFDYVALGHLHHPFAVNSATISYSGSLLKYSFSEADQPKGFRMIDTDDGITNTFIPLKPMRDVKVLEGSFDDFYQQPAAVHQEDYLKMILSDMRHVNDPMTKLKQVYPYLLELRHADEVKVQETAAVKIIEQSDADIMNLFAAALTAEPLTKGQLTIINRLHGGGDKHETD